jgi:hypothetical protein
VSSPPPSDMVVGAVFETTYCGKIEILSYNSARDITVKFLDSGTISHGIVAQRIRIGYVSDPFYPFTAGVGYMGVGPYGSKTHKDAYQRWSGIFYRIFLSKDTNNLSSYHDCRVDDRWCNFQSFAEWYYSQYTHPDEIYDIDKDLKVRGNRVYGPDTCLLIPESLNVLIASDKANPLAQGISIRHNKFRARVTIDGVRKTLGNYNSVEDAVAAYRSGRTEAIMSRSNKLHSEGKITDEILRLIEERYLGYSKKSSSEVT